MQFRLFASATSTALPYFGVYGHASTTCWVFPADRAVLNYTVVFKDDTNRSACLLRFAELARLVRAFFVCEARARVDGKSALLAGLSLAGPMHSLCPRLVDYPYKLLCHAQVYLLAASTLACRFLPQHITSQDQHFVLLF